MAFTRLSGSQGRAAWPSSRKYQKWLVCNHSGSVSLMMAYKSPCIQVSACAHELCELLLVGRIIGAPSIQGSHMLTGPLEVPPATVLLAACVCTKLLALLHRPLLTFGGWCVTQCHACRRPHGLLMVVACCCSPCSPSRSLGASKWCNQQSLPPDYQAKGLLLPTISPLQSCGQHPRLHPGTLERPLRASACLASSLSALPPSKLPCPLLIGRLSPSAQVAPPCRRLRPASPTNHTTNTSVLILLTRTRHRPTHHLVGLGPLPQPPAMRLPCGV